MKNIFNNSFHKYKYCHNKDIQFNINTINSHELSHELRSVEKGRIVVNCQGKTIIANEGDLFYIPFGRYADIKVFAEPICLGTVMRSAYMPEVDVLGYPPQIIKMSDEFKKLFDDIPILDRYEENVDSSVIWKVYKFLDVFQKEVVKYTDKHSLKIKKALAFMKENNNYTISELAEYCEMNERRFRAAFGKILCTTPIEIKQRIQAVKAETLLRTTELSIEDVAKEVGFSPNQLRNVMKKRYSALPKDIRKAEK